MSDNPQLSSDAFFALGFGVVALSGADAVKFAHAQCMSDVAGLADGHWQWSGWLTPKGRVIALFALLRLDAQTLWLLLPDGDAGELATQLRRFVFRSRLAIDARGDLAANGAFALPARARGASIDGSATQAVEVDLGAEGGARVVRIGPEPAPGDASALARWSAFDLAHGLPRLERSQREQWTPQMLSLDRLQAYSIKKGCYPGQEIVARTHFLGQAKRGLVLLEADAALAAGEDVSDGARAIGTIVSVAREGDASLALAVLPMDRPADGALRAGDTALRERALLGGLAR